MVTLTEGNLNHFTITTVDPEIREVIQIKAKESYQDLILDISQVEIIDSAGVGALVALSGYAKQSGLTLHLELLDGGNAHHIVEALFKAFARALRTAIAIDPRESGIPSTKGSL